MSSQLYIILTCAESQMPHLILLRYRSRFVWQSIRSNLTVEWGRPGVCKSDLIHRNFGKFSQTSPLFRAESNANFHMLLPVKVQTGVSCGARQLSAVIAEGNLGSERSNTCLCHGWILSQVLELSWAFPKE